MTDTKTCSKCGELKGLDEFTRNLANRDSLERKCKACVYSYVSANKEKISATKKKSAIKNAEAHRAACAAYREKNLEMCREASRARRKKSYQENPEKFRHLAREFAAANPIKRKSQYLRWKAENPEKVNVHVERMTNAYVAYALKMRVADASPELLALKREQLTIHRLSRQLKQATKPTKESP